MNEKGNSLRWKDLTEQEQSKVIASEELADPPQEYEYYRCGGEIYLPSDEQAWRIEIPSEYESLYPERFAYQDEGAEEPAEIITAVLFCLTGEFNQDAVLSDYIGVKQEHIGDFSVCWLDTSRQATSRNKN